MIEFTRRLPVNGPRHYTLRDAYRGRVWRSPTVVVGREILGWSVAATLFGFLANHNFIYALGVVGIAGITLFMIIGSIVTNLSRTKLVQSGHATVGYMEAPRRLVFMHELLRGEREKTFVLRFKYTDEVGTERVGKVWVCGCAKQYFPPQSEIFIIFHPTKSSKALPLRLAVMVAPH